MREVTVSFQSPLPNPPPNIDGKYDYAPCGMGDTHWGKIIATLYEMRYPGDMAIEPHSHFWAGEMKEAGLILAKRHLDQFIL